MNHVDPRIPSVIHEFWATLTAEVVWLHGRWIIYRQLYGTSEERIDVLNRSASTFFIVLNTTLLNDVQLSLSKLGDSAGTGRRRNMTLDALVEELEGVGETAVVAKLKPLVVVFDQACTKLRHRRDKWIVHFDLTTMLNAKVVPLEGPSRAEIEAALVALREAVNCVELHYTGTKTAHELFSMTHDGESLLATLKRGLRYSELVKDGSIARLKFLRRSSRGPSVVPGLRFSFVYPEAARFIRAALKKCPERGEVLSSRAAGGTKPRSGKMPKDGEGTQDCIISIK